MSLYNRYDSYSQKSHEKVTKNIYINLCKLIVASWSADYHHIWYYMFSPMCSNTCSVRSYANLINPSKINVYQLPTPAAPVNIDKLRWHDVKNAKTPVFTRVLASLIVYKLSDNLINILIIIWLRGNAVKSRVPRDFRRYNSTTSNRTI